MMKTVFLSLLVVMIHLGLGQLLYAQVTLESNELMGMEGLYFWYSDPDAPVAIYNRNITPKGDCFDIVNGYAFLTWYKGGMENRNLMVSRMKLGTNQWVTVEFPDKNTLYADGSGDSHKTASLGISSRDGTVHLVFDQHCQELYYCRSKKNIAFAPDAMFTLDNFLPKQNYLKEGEPIPSVTYPNFITNDVGELIFNFRIGTSRQGDMTGAYYDGNTWSSTYTIVKGNNVNPQFNLYGGLNYYYGRMYFSGAIRVYGSEITNNQGVYFGMSGQRGNETWYNLAGNAYSIPLSNTLTPFKIAEPVPEGHDGMTSAAVGVVTKNGARHFTAQVSEYGTFHYVIPPGSDTIIQGSAPAHLSFPAGDRVYCAYIANTLGRFAINSTPEDASDWRGEFGFRPANKFANIVTKYYNGKLYMVASEEKNSDKHPFRFLVFDLGIEEPVIELHYPLDGDVVEAGASGYDGTLIGGGFAPSLVQHDQGLVLDGVDDYVEIADYTGIVGSSARTCSAWIKTPGSASNMVILNWGTMTPGQQWLMGVYSTGQFGVYAGGPDIITDALVDDGLWHHVAAVITDDGSPNVDEIQLYIDGAFQNSQASSTEAVNTVPDGDVLMGALEYSPGQMGYYFNGQMDDVRIYSYALTEVEIQALASISRPSVDIVADDLIDWADLSALAADWLADDCYSANLCDGRDLNADQTVNLDDYSMLSQWWLEQMNQSTGSIGIDFSDPETPLMAISENAGAPGYEQSNWNSQDGNIGTLSNLLDGDGNATPASVSWTAHSDYVNTDIPDVEGNHRMMQAYLDTSDTSITQVTIDGIPYATYSVVLYMDGKNGGIRRNGKYVLVNPADESILAGPYYNQDAAGSQFDGTFIQTPLSTVDDATTPAGNYMVIEVLTAGSFRLQATGADTADTHPRGPVNAIQIVEQ